jgi:poly(3-hydroxybutyrate) depolymerase
VGGLSPTDLNIDAMRFLSTSLAAAATLAGTLALPTSALALDTGPSRFMLDGVEGFGATPEPMPVFTYRPAGWRSDGRVLLVMHGRGRDADRYRDEWIRHAEAADVLVVVPEFSNAKFPGRASYNFGGMVDSRGQPAPRERWAFGVMDKVFTEVKRRSGATRTRYALFGHSAGAQFVHRYLLLAEASDADLIITANAGSYTMPDRMVSFPFGLGGVAADDASLRRAFARPVVVLLGDQDIDPNHPSLPRDAAAMAQGPHRLARGQRFFETAGKAAATLGAPFTWRLAMVQGVAHDNGGMAADAMAYVTGAR